MGPVCCLLINGFCAGVIARGLAAAVRGFSLLLCVPWALIIPAPRVGRLVVSHICDPALVSPPWFDAWFLNFALSGRLLFADV